MLTVVFFNPRKYVPSKEDVGGFRDTCIRESQEEEDTPTTKTVILEFSKSLAQEKWTL